MQHAVWEYFLLIGGGFLAGIINTLAGNGSAITLPLLIFTGLDAGTANATNRVGVLVQSLTAVSSLRRTTRTRLLIKKSFWYYIPTILGSALGAIIAVDINPDALKLIIGFLMIFLLFTLIFKPKKWLIKTDPDKRKKTILQWVIFFAIGFYGGFIQMGIGIMILSSLVLLAKYSMRDANIIKLMVTLAMIIPAFTVFFFSGKILWIEGGSLAIGTSAGAWFAARHLLYHAKVAIIIRYVLMAVMIFAVGKIFWPYVFH